MTILEKCNMERKTLKTATFRRMRAGDPSIVLQLKSSKENNSLSVLLSRWNQDEGREANRHIHCAYDNENGVVELVCITYDEYRKELTGELPKDYWKQFLSKKC